MFLSPLLPSLCMLTWSLVLAHQALHGLEPVVQAVALTLILQQGFEQNGCWRSTEDACN